LVVTVLTAFVISFYISGDGQNRTWDLFNISLVCKSC